MKGFDSRFTDLPDYILKCTAQIWEGHDIAALDWHYGDDLIVRTPAGISRGNAAGKANTMATLSEFPDRQLLGEDVIWCGDDQSGIVAPHRIDGNPPRRRLWPGDRTSGDIPHHCRYVLPRQPGLGRMADPRQRCYRRTTGPNGKIRGAGGDRFG